MSDDNDAQKSLKSEGKRPVRITEYESRHPNGKKSIVKETFFEDGSSKKEESIFENDKMVSMKTLEISNSNHKDDISALTSISALDESHDEHEDLAGPDQQSKKHDDNALEKKGHGNFVGRRTAPATKLLPVEELITPCNVPSSQAEDNSSEQPVGGATQNNEQPNEPVENPQTLSNTDMEEGIIYNSIPPDAGDNLESNRNQVSNSADHQVTEPPEEEIVEAYAVPVEDQSGPIIEHKSIFLNKKGLIKKRCWFTFACLIALTATVAAIVAATSSKSSGNTAPANIQIEKVSPTMPPSDHPTLSPSLPPFVVIECEDLCVSQIPQAECPSSSKAQNLLPCNKVHKGELCGGNGDCGKTSNNLDNCGVYDVYRRIECAIDKPWAVGFNGTAFEFFEYYVEMEELDWLSHLKRATMNGADLVSLHSHEERIFVVNLMRRAGITEAAIGGMRRFVKDDSFTQTDNDENFWKWSDGTKWDKLFWNNGEPNDRGGSTYHETVVGMKRDGMNDMAPTNKHGGVYKRSTSRGPSPTSTYQLPPNLGCYHSCVTNNQMELFCMGSNFQGQLGIDDDGNGRNVPTLVNNANGEKVKKISMGLFHSCAILENDSLACWGYNLDGQLGIGNNIDRKLPRLLDLGPLRTAKQISLGAYHTCALLDDDSLKCWGRNSSGQLGIGSTTKKDTPTSVNVIPDGKTVKFVVAGYSHTCAILTDDSLRCWGSNSNGELGDNTVLTRTSSVNVALGKKVKTVSLGKSSSCAILVDDSLKCWGKNDYGELGINSTLNTSLPTLVDVGNETVKQISSTFNHRCAILKDDTLKCWGRNSFGQLGIGSISTRQNFPVAVFLGDKLVKQVSVGAYHTCAILSDDSLKCWGYGVDGQTGNEEKSNVKFAHNSTSLVF